MPQSRNGRRKSAPGCWISRRARSRPLFITEIGYPSLPWALKDPWNYVNSSEAKPGCRGRRRPADRAFLSAWKDLLTPPRAAAPATAPAAPAARDDFFAGCYFYEWDPYNSGGPDDTAYGVRGKPAYDLLKNFLAKQGFIPVPPAPDKK